MASFLYENRHGEAEEMVKITVLCETRIGGHRLVVETKTQRMEGFDRRSLCLFRMKALREKL